MKNEVKPLFFAFLFLLVILFMLYYNVFLYFFSVRLILTQIQRDLSRFLIYSCLFSYFRFQLSSWPSIDLILPLVRFQAAAFHKTINQVTQKKHKALFKVKKTATFRRCPIWRLMPNLYGSYKVKGLAIKTKRFPPSHA